MDPDDRDWMQEARVLLYFADPKPPKKAVVPSPVKQSKKRTRSPIISAPPPSQSQSPSPTRSDSSHSRSSRTVIVISSSSDSDGEEGKAGAQPPPADHQVDTILGERLVKVCLCTC